MAALVGPGRRRPEHRGRRCCGMRVRWCTRGGERESCEWGAVWKMPGWAKIGGSGWQGEGCPPRGGAVQGGMWERVLWEALKAGTGLCCAAGSQGLAAGALGGGGCWDGKGKEGNERSAARRRGAARRRNAGERRAAARRDDATMRGKRRGRRGRSGDHLSDGRQGMRCERKAPGGVCDGGPQGENRDSAPGRGEGVRAALGSGARPCRPAGRWGRAGRVGLGEAGRWMQGCGTAHWQGWGRDMAAG